MGTAVDGALRLVGMEKAKPPVLIKFESPVEESSTGIKTVFTFTADSSIDGVRVMDEQGSEVRGQLAVVDPERTVWTLAVVFDEPVSGQLRAELLKGDTWYDSGKSIHFTVLEPTPVPTEEPAPMPVFDPSATRAPETLPQETVDPEEIPEPPDEAASAGDTQGDFLVQPQVTLQPTQPPPVTVITISPQTSLAAVTDAPPMDEGQDVPEAMDKAAADDAAAEDLPGDEPVMDDPDALAAADPDTQDPDAQDPGAPEPGVAEPAAQDAQMPEPTAEPRPQTPAPSPMPALTASADAAAAPDKFKVQETVFVKGKRVKELQRDLAVSMPEPGRYATYEGGVFTFRGDSFRGNAAAGAPEMPLKQLSLLWKAPLGSLRTSSGTLYGMGWTGQPAIVLWSKELREWMNIDAAKKDVIALKEVIAAAQDGKIYFFDLNDGVATREPIDLGYPMKGSVSIDPRGQPLLGVGQGVSQMPSGSKPIGFYLYELLEQKQLYFLNGRRTKTQQQFSTNGAFDGTALFERESDTLVLAGENGLLYTLALGTKFDYLDTRTLKVSPSVTYQRFKGADQQDMATASEASVAMYGRYIYAADRHGYLRCVDADTMKSVWVFDTGDNTDATPALGFDEDGSLGLYTGTTVFTRSRRKGEAVIRRLDALTGREVWQVTVPAKYDKTERSGVKASPVVGEGAAKDLVFFTVNMTGEGKTATLLALNKRTGQETWRAELEHGTVSSPVAVYNKAGEAFIIQADEAGTLYLFGALDGQELHRLELGAGIRRPRRVQRRAGDRQQRQGQQLPHGIRLE